MPNIIACYKWVIDEADIKVDAKTRELQFDRVNYKISEYDRNAIEEAVKICEAQGGEVIALTAGTEKARASLKDALSRGPAQAIYVNDELLGNADAFITARVLAKAVAKVPDYQMIICGEGSSDQYNQQVGPQLAALLGIPAITFVNKLTVLPDKVVAERKLEDGIEVVEAAYPVLVTVLPDINKARIPSLKQILGASKKPVKEIKLPELGLTPEELKPCFKVASALAYVMARKQQRITGDSINEMAEKAVAALVKEGVVG